MPLDFPNSPTTGQIYTENGNSWKYNGSVWLALSNSSDFTASSTAPLTPKTGDMWFDTDNGKLYIYYDSYWVNPAVVGGGALTASASTITGTNAEGSATTYAKSDHNHAYGSKSIPQSALALGPTFVSTLPSSPVDGQEVYYQASGDMATNGVVWHLRYRSGSSSSYKWECVGGSPLSTNSIADPGAVSMTANQWADVSSSISITAPLEGDYFVSASSSVLRSSGTNVVYIGIKNGATEDVLNGIVTITLTNYWHHTSVGGVVTSVGAGGASKTIALRYLTDTNITNGFRRRSACLEIRPIRVI